MNVSDDVFTKIIAYAAKYPAANLLGVLIGTAHDKITDMLPLSHTYANPMTTQSAMDEIEKHAKSRSGFIPCGIFWASESAHLNGVSAGALSLLMSIARNSPSGHATVLRLKATQFEAFAQDPEHSTGLLDAFIVKASAQSKDVAEQIALSSTPEVTLDVNKTARSRSLEIVRNNLESLLVDFDDYVDTGLKLNEWLTADAFRSSSSGKREASDESKKDE